MTILNNTSSKGLNKAVQGDYMSDPRLALAMELQRSGVSTAPVSSHLEGLARALTGVVGGYQQKQLRNEYSAKGDELTNALSSAMSSPAVSQGVKPFIDPGSVNNPEMGTVASQGGQTLVPAVEPGYDALAAALQSQKGYGDNKYIQDAAQGYKAKALEDRAKMQSELQQKRAEYTDPQILAGKMALARAGRSVTNVNMGAQEKEEDKAIGKAFGEQYVDIQKTGMAAPGKIAKLDRLTQLLDGVETGTFKGTTNELKAAAKGAGINIEALGLKDDVAPVQAAVALTNAMALEMRNPSGGAGMPGAMSDADRNYLSAMQPGIEKTPEGRKMMIETQRQLAKRDKEVAQLSRNYRQKNGRLDEGFYNVLADYSEKNPLFGKQETDKPSAPTSDNAVKFLGFE